MVTPIYRWNECWLATLAVIWGGILMLPGDLFAGIDRYRLMSQYLPDWAWGVCMFSFGIILFFHVPLWLHKHAHFFLCGVWLGITLLSLLAVMTPSVILIASLLFIIAMFHAGKYFRLSHPIVIAK